MKMPDIIEDIMLAPCGINCAVCYRHVGMRKRDAPCEACLKGDSGKTERCLNCNIKSCVQNKGHVRCYECADFPCKLIKNLEKTYSKRYNTSLIENSGTAEEIGVAAFLEQDRQRWTCLKCGGAFSLHDGVCSECGCDERRVI